MKRVLVPVARGTEEMEAVISIDLLRRAGCETIVAGLDPGIVTASRGVRIAPDVAWESVDPTDFDAILLPGGGEGTQRFLGHEGLLAAVRSLHAAGRWVAAVCAAPLVLQAAGILGGRRATCHPSVADRLVAAVPSDDPVVTDGTVITSRGAGTSIPFALELIRRLCGDAAADRVAAEIVYSPSPAAPA